MSNGEEESKGEERPQPPAALYLFPNVGARVPEYWNFVKMIAPSSTLPPGQKNWRNKDAIGMWCERCKERMEYTSGNSNTIRRHMQGEHLKFLQDYQKDEAARVEKEKKRKGSDLRNFYNTAHPFKKHKNASDADNQRVKELAAEWIAGSYRPYSIVEDKGLIQLFEFVNNLNTTVKLPGRTSVTEQAGIMARNLRGELRKVIYKDCMYYSWTTDIWSSRALDAYMAFTLHYCKENFDLVQWTLEVKKFPGSHTGVKIAAELNAVIDEWGLNRDHLTFAIRDNAANGVLAMKLMNIDDFGCFAHSMQLAIAPLFFPKKKNNAEEETETMLDGIVRSEVEQEFEALLTGSEKELVKTVSQYTAKQRKLAKYFSNSPKGVAMLKQFQTRHTKVATILDCVTRWGSTYDLQERNLLLRDAFGLFFAFLNTNEGKKEFKDFKAEMPSDDEWFICAALKILLQRFKESTLLLGGEKYPTLPLAFPCLRLIKTHLSNEHVLADLIDSYKPSNFAIVLADRIRVYLLEKFCLRFRDLPGAVMSSTILHPGFIKLKHLSEVEKEQTTTFLINECLKLQQEHDELELAAESALVETAAAAVVDLSGAINVLQPVIVLPDTTDSVHAMFGDDSSDDESAHTLERNETTYRLQAVAEVSNYKSLAKQTFNKKSKDMGAALTWWKTNRHNFPMISRVARKWFGALCTSVPSERAFSSSGNVVTRRRASLHPENVRDLVFLHDNL